MGEAHKGKTEKQRCRLGQRQKDNREKTDWVEGM